MAKVVVISAHPDDEVLGCGGTLIKHKNLGDEIYWIITTCLTEDQGFKKERILDRKKEIVQVANMLGVVKTFELEFPTMSLDGASLNKMVPMISLVFNEIEPEVVYVLNRSDAHTDHHITFQAVFSSTKSFRHPYIKKVLMYECISETEFGVPTPENAFVPNYFVDISESIVDKLEVMHIYASELSEHPFPRSTRNIKALATYRGATAGVEYAEAFQLLKYIDK